MTDEIHVSTKDKPGDYDALETAKPDEPIFVLQGGDPFGPPTVQHWAELAREEARALQFGPPDLEGADREAYRPTEEQQARADKLLRKATQAEQVSWEMKAYQRGERAAPETRARYNEELVAPADTAERTAARKALISGVGALHNAVGQAEEVRELLVTLEVHEAGVDLIARGIALLNEAAATIEPRRGSERS